MVIQLTFNDIKEETTSERLILNDTETSSETMEDVTTETSAENKTLITKDSGETTSYIEDKNSNDDFLKLYVFSSDYL